MKLFLSSNCELFISRFQTVVSNRDFPNSHPATTLSMVWADDDAHGAKKQACTKGMTMVHAYAWMSTTRLFDSVKSLPEDAVTESL